MIDEQLIDLEAFQSVELRIAMSNGTSRSQISDGLPASPRVSLIEFLDHGMALEAPRNSCAQGHSMIIKLSVIDPPSKRMQLAMTSKVESVTKDSDLTERIDLTLVQYEEDAWDRLLKLYANRQLEIEEFFKAAKGF